MRHKHADLIIEWANTGCAVQYKADKNQPWGDTLDPHWIPGFEYRKKPVTLKYIRYVADYGDGPVIGVMPYSDTFKYNKDAAVIEWIDSEWQEVEVEL